MRKKVVGMSLGCDTLKLGRFGPSVISIGGGTPCRRFRGFEVYKFMLSNYSLCSVYKIKKFPDARSVYL